MVSFAMPMTVFIAPCYETISQLENGPPKGLSSRNCVMLSTCTEWIAYLPNLRKRGVGMTAELYLHDPAVGAVGDECRSEVKQAQLTEEVLVWFMLLSRLPYAREPCHSSRIAIAMCKRDGLRSRRMQDGEMRIAS